MLASKLLKSKLPQPWIGCVSALESHTRQLYNIEQWLKAVEQSNEPGRLCWADLLKCLTQDEPVLENNNNSLKFIPLLLHLPNSWQCYLLTFIYQHRHAIAQITLLQFVDVIQGYIRLINETNASTRPQRAFSCQLQQPYLPKEAAMPDIFIIGDEPSDVNETQSKHKTWNDIHDWLRFWMNKLQSFTDCSSVKQTHSLHWRNAEEKERILEMCNVRNKKKDDNGHNPWSSALWNNSRSSPELSHVGVEPLSSLHDDSTFYIESEDIALFDPDTPTLTQAKRFKLDSTVLEQSLSTPSSVNDEDIPQLFLVNLLAMKEAWHSNSVNTKPEDLVILTQCSADLMPRMCTALDIVTLPESCLSTVTMEIARLKEQLPLSHAAILAEKSLLQKMLHLETSASRHLQQACVNLTKAYPCAVIQSVIVPVLLHVNLGSHQCDLIMKLLRDTLDVEDKQQLLQTYVEREPTLNSAVLLVIQQMVDNKTVMEGKTLNHLMSILNKSSTDFLDNLRFGKLVLGVIKNYSKQLTSHHVNQLIQVMASHKTFLKKSVLVALKKVSCT